MKKGMTKFFLNEQEEEKFLAFKPIRPDLINWEKLKQSEKFAVKSYKNPLYRGEIIDSMRLGKRVII